MKKSNADDVYSDKYHQLLNQGVIGVVSDLTHKSLEKQSRSERKHFPVVLEIGAGQGQHFKHVTHSFDTYYETDIRLDLLKRGTQDRTLQRDSRVIQMSIDAEDLSFFRDGSVDRIILSCVLAHLERPKTALLEMRRILRPSGQLVIYLPSEPGLLLRVTRFMTTVQKARAMGFSHLPFHYQEHRNHFLYLKYVLREVFDQDITRSRSFPFPGMSWNFSLWKTYTVVRKNG